MESLLGDCWHILVSDCRHIQNINNCNFCLFSFSKISFQNSELVFKLLPQPPYCQNYRRQLSSLTGVLFEAEAHYVAICGSGVLQSYGQLIALTVKHVLNNYSTTKLFPQSCNFYLFVKGFVPSYTLKILGPIPRGWGCSLFKSILE